MGCALLTTERPVLEKSFAVAKQNPQIVPRALQMTMTVGGETVTVYNDDFFDKIRQKCGHDEHFLLSRALFFNWIFMSCIGTVFHRQW